MRSLRSRFLVVLTIAAILVPIQALPPSYEVRREIREDIRDQYWRDGRYYRDGRNWEQHKYLRRYYGTAGDDGFLEGIAVGAAVIGVTFVIIHSRHD